MFSVFFRIHVQFEFIVLKHFQFIAKMLALQISFLLIPIFFIHKFTLPPNRQFHPKCWFFKKHMFNVLFQFSAKMLALHSALESNKIRTKNQSRKREKGIFRCKSNKNSYSCPHHKMGDIAREWSTTLVPAKKIQKKSAKMKAFQMFTFPPKSYSIIRAGGRCSALLPRP